jgi:hypothetical protein
MRSFACPVCGQLVFFENSECLRCHSALGFAPDEQDIVAIATAAALDASPPSTPSTPSPYRRCTNEVRAACNWLVVAADTETIERHDGLCLSCRLTRTRPNDADDEALAAFAATEAAKRRLVFQLLDLGLPIDPYDEGDGQGLAFDLLSSQFETVTTGHAHGLITLDLSETDDSYREGLRHDLGESYRTVLGHLRHEIGHYYFPLIVAHDPGLSTRARKLFGDDTVDYGEALDAHYRQGAPPDWPDSFVSAYATMHPFEDWAETFAHYLHIRDTLQTAAAFGMVVNGPVVDTTDDDELISTPDLDNDDNSFREILADWLPLTYALNAVNRSMGNDDLYPFVLAPRVVEKLTFAHRVVRRAQLAHA